MQGITIGYDFRFNLVIKKRNGKIFKRHIVSGLGINFDSALWDVYFKLKKRKSEILTITSAEPTRIAFAFQGEQSLSLKLAEYPPAIPGDMEKARKHFPKS